MASVAFSSDSVEVISRRLDSLTCRTTGVGLELAEYYEIGRCKDFILVNDFKKVALQFPDNLLCDSTEVATALCEGTGREIFILGDTSYGSCCVDEVAAEHSAADGIIHFGPSCLTRTKRIPVLFVFGREEVDIEACGRSFREAFPSLDQNVLVLCATPYQHCLSSLRDSLHDYCNCVWSELVLPGSCDKTTPLVETTLTSQTPPVSSTADLSAPFQDQSHLHSSSVDGAITATNPGPAFLSSHAHVTHSSCATPTVPSSTGDTPTFASMEPVPCTRSSCCSETPSSGLLVGKSGGGCGSSAGECAHGESAAVPSGSGCEISNLLHNRFGRRFNPRVAMENYQIFYIGREGPTLTNFLLNYSRCKFVSYDPITKQWRRESASVNKSLGKRYYLVQKAKEAKTVGILVGTLGAADYLEVIERLKTVMKQAGKKYYTVAVGKLNVPKLANFLEIDIFVLVACPENSLVESQEFFKPVVTPYELELACLRSKDWTGEYTTDYQDILPGACFHTDLEEYDGGEAEREPEFSLITGAFVPSRETSQTEEGHTMALAPRSKMEVVEHNSAMAYLQNRSWQGLEQKLGVTDVGVAVEGRSGIATAYKNEFQ